MVIASEKFRRLRRFLLGTSALAMGMTASFPSFAFGFNDKSDVEIHPSPLPPTVSQLENAPDTSAYRFSRGWNEAGGMASINWYSETPKAQPAIAAEVKSHPPVIAQSVEPAQTISPPAQINKASEPLSAGPTAKQPLKERDNPRRIARKAPAPASSIASIPAPSTPPIAAEPKARAPQSQHGQSSEQKPIAFVYRLDGYQGSLPNVLFRTTANHVPHDFNPRTGQPAAVTCQPKGECIIINDLDITSKVWKFEEIYASAIKDKIKDLSPEQFQTALNGSKKIPLTFTVGQDGAYIPNYPTTPTHSSAPAVAPSVRHADFHPEQSGSWRYATMEDWLGGESQDQAKIIRVGGHGHSSQGISGGSADCGTSSSQHTNRWGHQYQHSEGSFGSWSGHSSSVYIFQDQEAGSKFTPNAPDAPREPVTNIYNYTTVEQNCPEVKKEVKSKKPRRSVRRRKPTCKAGTCCDPSTIKREVQKELKRQQQLQKKNDEGKNKQNKGALLGTGAIINAQTDKPSQVGAEFQKVVAALLSRKAPKTSGAALDAFNLAKQILEYGLIANTSAVGAVLAFMDKAASNIGYEGARKNANATLEALRASRQMNGAALVST